MRATTLLQLSSSGSSAGRCSPVSLEVAICDLDSIAFPLQAPKDCVVHTAMCMRTVRRVGSEQFGRLSFSENHALDRPPMHQEHLRGEVPSTHDIVNLMAFKAELPHGAEYACVKPGADAMFPDIHGRAGRLEGWESTPSLPFTASSTLLSPQKLSYCIVLDERNIPSPDVVDQVVKVMVDEHERDHRRVLHTLDNHEMELRRKSIER